MTILTKLTPAQANRTRQVQKGEITRYGNDRVEYSSFRHTDGSWDPGKIPMWVNLTRGGMVRWEPNPPPYDFMTPFFKAVLTPEGATLLAKHSVLRKKVTR